MHYIKLNSNEAGPTTLIQTVLKWTHILVFASGMGISIEYIYVNGIYPIKWHANFNFYKECPIALLKVTTNKYPHKSFINTPLLSLHEIKLFFSFVNPTGGKAVLIILI